MHDELIVYGLTIFLFLLISAFFYAAETAMTAISRPRIYQLVMEGSKAAKLVNSLRQRKESMIGTVLLGYNAVNIGASVLATSLSIKYFGNGQELVFTTLLMTFLVVVFTEVLPKTYAIQNAETVSLKLAPALQVCVTLLYPLTRCIQLLIHHMMKMFGVNLSQKSNLVSGTDVIRGTIELYHREGKMIKQDRDMLGSILDLNDIAVEEIMIHRKQVETLNIDLPPIDLVDQAVSNMHSRIPLWRDEPDNIIGLLHVKNLIKALNDHADPTGATLTTSEIQHLCSKPWFVPETTSLRDQLLAFRSKRQHFAFVVDEYGGWQGIVTLEDIIEEIVGDIEDEHDEGQSDIQKAGDNAYYVNGGLSVRDLNRSLDWNLPDENATTVAGLLIHEAETIPSVSEQFDIHGFRFTVISKEATQLTRLRIEKLPDTVLPEYMDV